MDESYCDHCPSCGFSMDFQAVQTFRQIQKDNVDTAIRIAHPAVVLAGEPKIDGGEGLTAIFGLVYDIENDWVSVIDVDGMTYAVPTNKVVGMTESVMDKLFGAVEN